MDLDLTHLEPMTMLGIAALGVLAIVAVNALAPRANVAAPLVLVLVGVAVSFLPQVPPVLLEPEWILAGVLPPLLYSSAVSMPTMDFRRDFTAISALSVLLVLLSSVLLGWLFTHLIPGLSLPLGIALGAIVSPTDAVATQIVKRLDASPRVVTVLEGESLLNDASALVLLRSAIAATAGTVSLWSVAGRFVYAVVLAVAIGVLVGRVGLRVRARVRNAALSTAVSFVVPFLAFLPAEHLHASGLVAVVVAGLVTGNGSARHLRPEDRLAETSNWRTVELLLEGGVFLLMGLELFGLLTEVREDHGSLARAVQIALLATVVLLAVRVLFVAPMLVLQHRRAVRGRAMRDRIDRVGQRLDAKLARVAAEGATEVTLTAKTHAVVTGRPLRRGHSSRHGEPQTVPVERASRWREMLVRRTADIDYLTSEPLGWREGVLLVWAGMRGVVTLAAAQSLPADTPHRAVLILIAFLVAAGTLLVQGGTLPWLLRALRLGGAGPRSASDRMAVRFETDSAAVAVFDDPDLRQPDGEPYDPAVVERVRHDMVREHGSQDDDEIVTRDRFVQYKELRLRTIEAQREALLAARTSGVYSSAALGYALDALDLEQLSVEMRRGPVGRPAD